VLNVLNPRRRNIDRFCFWLKDEEDGDPATGEQYARWREMRTLPKKAPNKKPD
jgi:hypothetical protein